MQIGSTEKSFVYEQYGTCHPILVSAHVEHNAATSIELCNWERHACYTAYYGDAANRKSNYVASFTGRFGHLTEVVKKFNWPVFYCGG